MGLVGCNLQPTFLMCFMSTFAHFKIIKQVDMHKQPVASKLVIVKKSQLSIGVRSDWLLRWIHKWSFLLVNNHKQQQYSQMKMPSQIIRCFVQVGKYSFFLTSCHSHKLDHHILLLLILIIMMCLQGSSHQVSKVNS